MKALIALLALVVLAVLAFNSFDPVEVERRRSEMEFKRQAQAIDLSYQQLQLDEREQLSKTKVATDQFLYILSGVALLGLAVGAADFYMRRRDPLVKADQRGMYPVDRASLTEGRIHDLIHEAMQQYHRTNQLQAIHQPGQQPHALHYAPHDTYAPKTSAPAVITDSSKNADEERAQVAIPKFSDLLDQRKIGIGHPLLLAVDLDDGHYLEGTWLDLYSTAIAGLPGTGKTTSQRFYACQTALHGAQFIIVDPHADAGEDSLAATLHPLRSRFVCDPASDDKAILNAVKLAASIGQRRANGDKDRQPIIVWIDELTALLARSSVREPVAELIEQIAQEYRKVGVYATASGQIWTASRTGDSSALRDSFASALVHRMKRNQARLLLPSEDAARVERLPKGHAMLWRTSGESTLVAIPMTTGDDVVRVGGMITGENQPAIIAQSSHNQPHESAPRSAPGRARVLTPEDERIVDLFFQGLDTGAIVSEITGMKSSAGAPYQRKLREFHEVLRVNLRGEA